MKRRTHSRLRPGPGRRKEAMEKTTKIIGRMTKTIGEESWEGLFASGTLARLLTTFLTRPETAFYQKELADAAGTGLYAVQRELARLERAGLVVRTPRGNRIYYRADPSHSVFEDLKRVILKTMGLGDALRAALAALADRVRVAFIYGSLARSEETAGSDTDLLVVGDLTLREASAVLGPAGRDLGREFNAAIYSAEEFRTKAREGHHFVSEVVKGEKIYLIGDEIDLKGLAG
jgi:predicted nucleotidyltransferase